MEETNLPKIEVKADLTKTIESAYDDTLKKPLKSSSNVLTTVLDFFHNTILYPMQKYNLYAKSKLENYSYELQERAKAIPEENLISPRVNILGPTFDGLKYNLDEDHIKEMFTNILISDMDNRKQDKVLPSYIEIVKQLSKDDAVFLKTLKESSSYSKGFYCLELNNSEKYILLKYTDNLECISNSDVIYLSNIIIDNLLRLRLINIPSDRIFINSKVYQKIYEIATSKSLITVGNYTPRMLSVTDFGKNFLDICLS